MTIDLHGIKHEDVSKLIDASIYKCLKTKKSRLWVITGNSQEMKRIVKTVADEHGLTAVESLFSNTDIIIDFI